MSKSVNYLKMIVNQNVNLTDNGGNKGGESLFEFPTDVYLLGSPLVSTEDYSGLAKEKKRGK